MESALPIHTFWTRLQHRNISLVVAVDPDTQMPMANGVRAVVSHAGLFGRSIVLLELVGGACRSTQTAFQCLHMVEVVVVCTSMQSRRGMGSRKVSLVLVVVNSSSQRFLH